MKHVYFLLSLLFLHAAFFMACTSTHTDKKPLKRSLSKLSCDSVLHLLVKSCFIDNNLKNKMVIPDGLNNDSLLIKIYHENEAEPGAIVDAADGFLLITLKDKRIFEAVIEPESLKKIDCDTNILKHYINHCQSSYSF